MGLLRKYHFILGYKKINNHTQIRRHRYNNKTYCTFEKKYYVIDLCLSVYPSVTAFMARWLYIATQYHVIALHFARTENAMLVNVIRFRILTIRIICTKSRFGLYILKLWVDSHQNLTVYSSTWGTTSMMRILRFFDNSRFYDHMTNE